MNHPTKWAIYARKSEESEDRQVQSLPDQIRYLTEMAERSGLRVVEIIQEAKTAKKPYNRKEFTRLVSMIKKGSIDGLLCWKLNRLSRNPIDSGEIQWMLQEGIIKCIKTSDRDHLPNDNALLFAVEQGMSNQYSRELAQNVKRGLESKAKQGWYPGIPPIGYLNTNWGKKGLEEIRVDKERFQLVRKMWDLMLSGTYLPMEIWRIATREWKLDTPKRRRNGKMPMAQSYVDKMFNNLFYTGSFSYGGKIYQGKHKPMITMEEFDKVQVLLGNKAQSRPILHDFAYTGIMKCANCGASITASEKKKLVKTSGEYKAYTYYHCTRKVAIDVCREPPIALADLEWQIENRLAKNQIGELFYNLGIETLNHGDEQETEARNMIYANQTAAIGEIQRKLERLRTFLVNETLSEEEYIREKQGLERRLVIETGKLAQLDATLGGFTKRIKDTLEFARSAIYSLKTGDPKTKKSILLQLGSNQRLSQKKLYMNEYSWFEVIKKGEQQLLKAIDRFELETGNKIKPENMFPQFSPLMCGVVEDVRTKFANSTTPSDIPNLSSSVKEEKLHRLAGGLELPGNSPN